MIKSCLMYSKVEISNIVVRGVKVKKSEIRLKSENLHPCIKNENEKKTIHFSTNNLTSPVGEGGEVPDP